MKIKILIVFISATLFSSCAYIFNGLVFPNQCKKCSVIDKYTNEIVWSDEGCGSAVTGLEEDAKVRAYDMNAGSYSTRYEVSCDTWSNKNK